MILPLLFKRLNGWRFGAFLSHLQKFVRMEAFWEYESPEPTYKPNLAISAEL